jgi:hypothetical protein
MTQRLGLTLAIVPVLIANTAAAQGAEKQWQLGPQLFTIGSETVAHSQFARIVNVLLLTDSGVIVANGGSKELRFFDAGGRFVRHVGRDGAGPGEYRFLDRVFRLAGDSLGVYDFSLRRLTVLSPEGAFARTVIGCHRHGRTNSGRRIRGRLDCRVRRATANPGRWSGAGGGPSADGNVVSTRGEWRVHLDAWPESRW